jgi:hypothetical protein
MIVDPSATPKRWCRHSLALKGVKRADIIEWAESSCSRPEPGDHQLMTREELRFLTRRLALGDPVYLALKCAGFPNSPSLRKILSRIQNFLVSTDRILRPNNKMAILNSIKVEAIKSGRIVPLPITFLLNSSGSNANRFVVYYMIYLRHVKNLSVSQISRLTNSKRVKQTLNSYGLFSNPKARASRSYATGRKKHKKPMRIEWVNPRRLVTTSPLDKSTYRTCCRHFTNVMVAKYGHLIDNSEKLNEYGYVVDHMLSLRDGFGDGVNQIPWQMLCHPANLQVLSAFNNTSKGADSSISSATLEKRISQFNLANGTVLIPIDTSVIQSLVRKYQSMASHRRAA